MEYLVIIIIVILCSGLILYFYHRFVTKTYPQKTDKLLNSVSGLDEIGLKRNENVFNGVYRNYFVSVYATTSVKSYDVYGGDRFQVWVATAPEPEQLKQIGGFFGKYLVSGEKEGFAYVGFMVNAKTSPDIKDSIIKRLDLLINLLDENRIKPFKTIY